MTAHLISNERPARHLREPESRARSLRDAFDARRNHVTAIRLGLATVVAVTHALVIGFGERIELGATELGDLAVDAFFILSGFLITASYLRLRSPVRYAWHRFLRIMPAFWVCLVVTAAVVAPVLAAMQGRSPLSVFTAPDESAVGYVVANGALLMRQYGIDGLPAGVPTPAVLDGSLWSLFYEAVCYAGVLGLAAIGGLRRRPGLTLAALACVWALVAADSLGLIATGQERMPRLAMLFLIGAAAWLYAHRIPVRSGLAAAAAVVLLASMTLEDYAVVGGVALAYLCLWLAVYRPPVNPLRRDLSYGLYIYHWPVQQLLVVGGLAAWGRSTFILISIGLTLVAAAASWHGIEKPALGRKDAAWFDRVSAVTRSPFRLTRTPASREV